MANNDMYETWIEGNDEPGVWLRKQAFRSPEEAARFFVQEMEEDRGFPDGNDEVVFTVHVRDSKGQTWTVKVRATTSRDYYDESSTSP